MKYVLSTILLWIFCSNIAFAQIPEDAFRFSWMNPSGTARQQSIGGAMGSLGGEISSMWVNPAGIGFYKTTDIVASPGIHFLSDKSNFRGTAAPGSNATSFNLGTTGFVIGSPVVNGSNSAIGIAVNRTVNFSSHINYNGLNDYSSFAEQYAEEFANSHLTIDDALVSPGVSYGTRMALYTYLIDTATINGSQQVISLPLRAGLLSQQNNISTSGGVTEIAISYAKNFKDKWYVGGTLGVPLVNYRRTQTFVETDATGNTNNDFASCIYSETFKSTGFGLNAKLGVIYRPMNSLRLGLAVHSPTIYGLKDRLSASMITNTENYAHEQSVTTDILDQAAGSSANGVLYDVLAPWKFLISASYLFQESEDVAKQRGFITFDAGFITNNTSHFYAEPNTMFDDSYFSGVNSAIKSTYKSTFDLHLGGELKFNTIMARAGIAYFSNPYKNSELKANRLFLTCGAGYRNKGLFIDVAYVLGFINDVNFPYRLSDKANTFATIKETNGTIIATIGLKF